MFASPSKVSVFVWSEYNLHQNTGCIKVKELLSKESIIRVLGLERLVQMCKSMKSSWIKMSTLSVWWKKKKKRREMGKGNPTIPD